MKQCIFLEEIEDELENRSILCRFTGEVITEKDKCAKCIYNTDQEQEILIIRSVYEAALKDKKIRKKLFNK